MGCNKVVEGVDLACHELEAIARGLKQAARNAGPLTLRGIALLQIGKRERAARLFQAAAAENPEDLAAWLWRAATLTDTSQQRACLTQAARIDPTNPAARFGLDFLSEHVPTSTKPAGTEQRVYKKTPVTQPMHARPRGWEESSPNGHGPLRAPVILRAGPSLLPVTGGSALLALGMGALAGVLSQNQALMKLWPIFLLLILTGIAVILAQFAWRMSVECILTNQWLVIQSGLLRRQRNIIPLTALERVEVAGWPAMRRLSGTGDVLVRVRGAVRSFRLRDMSSCDLVAGRISAAQRMALRRRSRRSTANIVTTL